MSDQIPAYVELETVLAPGSGEGNFRNKNEMF
jgi:hypothetical protein